MSLKIGLKVIRKTMVISIIGLGLIGGSMALALKKSKFCKQIIGVDVDGENLKVALDRGVIDLALDLDAAIEKSNIIILAASIDQNKQLAKSIIDRISNEKIIMDVGSTKI